MVYWIICSIPLFVNIIFVAIDGEKQTNKNSVRAPRSVRIVSWISSAGAAIISASFLLAKYRGRAWSVVCGFSVLALLFLVIAKSLQIDYNRESFSVRLFWGKPKTYSYKQIDGVIIGSGGSFKLIVKGKRLFVDSIMEGNDTFLAHIQSRYTQLCGKGLPIMEEALFHGYIRNPGEILLALLIVPVILTALGTFIIIREANACVIPDDMYPVCFSILDYKIINKVTIEAKTTAGTTRIMIAAVNDKEFLFHKFDDDVNFSALVSLRYISKEGQKEYYIWRLSDEDGNKYADEESVLKAKKEFFIRSTKVVIIVLVTVWAIFVGCIYTINHAPDHPFLMRILVKKSNWAF